MCRYLLRKCVLRKPARRIGAMRNRLEIISRPRRELAIYDTNIRSL
jgi:hypothetical protein